MRTFNYLIVLFSLLLTPIFAEDNFTVLSAQTYDVKKNSAGTIMDWKYKLREDCDNYDGCPEFFGSKVDNPDVELQDLPKKRDQLTILEEWFAYGESGFSWFRLKNLMTNHEVIVKGKSRKTPFELSGDNVYPLYNLELSEDQATKKWHASFHLNGMYVHLEEPLDSPKLQHYYTGLPLVFIKEVSTEELQDDSGMQKSILKLFHPVENREILVSYNHYPSKNRRVSTTEYYFHKWIPHPWFYELVSWQVDMRTSDGEPLVVYFDNSKRAWGDHRGDMDYKEKFAPYSWDHIRKDDEMEILKTEYANGKVVYQMKNKRNGEVYKVYGSR